MQRALHGVPGLNKKNSAHIQKRHWDHSLFCAIGPTVLHQDIGKKHKHARRKKRTQQVVLKPVADSILPKTDTTPPEHEPLPTYSKFDFAGTDIPDILSSAKMAIIKAAMHQDPNLAPVPVNADDRDCLGDVLNKLSLHRDAENTQQQTKKKAETEKKMSHAVSVRLFNLEPVTAAGDACPELAGRLAVYHATALRRQLLCCIRVVLHY
jgi:hypothetical protein